MWQGEEGIGDWPKSRGIGEVYKRQEQANVRLLELEPIGGTAGRDTYERLLLHNTNVIDQALR